MEKNEQELRKYLLRRLREYCYSKRVCNDCDVQETCLMKVGPVKATDPISKLLELYYAMYPDMKPNQQLIKEAEMEANKQMKKEFAELFVNQRAKADYGKEQLTLVPRRIIHDICAIRMYGNEKYPDGGPDNWKRVAKERYRDAAYRHFLAYLDDPQGRDKESGFPHLWHLACNIAFLCEFEDEEAVKLSQMEKSEDHCRNCLYSDEDENGDHCSECMYNHFDNFVRRPNDR